MADRRLFPAEVDQLEHQVDLSERALAPLACPRAGESVLDWLGRAARTVDARRAVLLALGLGLLPRSPAQASRAGGW